MVPAGRPVDPANLLATFHLYEPGGWDPWAALVRGARERGLRVIGYTSPDYQGATLPNPHSPLGEQLPFLFLSEFANEHPVFWARDRTGQDSLARGGFVLLDLRHSRARDHLARELSAIVQQTDLDTLELEWLCGTGDAYPYDCEASTGLKEGIVAFLSQVRQELGPDRRLSVAVEDSLERAGTWGYAWPSWAASGLVNRVVLRHRGQDLAQMANRVRRARAALGQRVELVSQLDCWRENGLRDGALLAQAMDLMREAGADRVAIYRADAVEALGLWESVRS
jgi:hypothetical protein